MSVTAVFKMSFRNHSSSLAKQLLISLVIKTKQILSVWKTELETRTNPPESQFYYV